MTNFDKEMQDALRADAEKLRATGVDVADPVFLDEVAEPLTYQQVRAMVIDELIEKAKADKSTRYQHPLRSCLAAEWLKDQKDT